ncbi:MAG: O-acetylhomoserine aminocarboxypropyltransferase [Gammaproteobacteria bacterium]|nr:O-acetylhomoserine aminocarboxypropyltransferase [Gammaproteobacteria bacterium]MDH3430344.1 O-acetylhomoserine aminocarboxypropyltransferase [Gammaproteobacteria bacterium]MDH3434790.1 O-acetylhomoserine aminocarboxypropyltransferase [Gammaproteobacteria bacterium]
MSRFLNFDTLSLHAGQTVDAEHGARATPIYQTTSYVFPDTDTASSIFNLERGGHAYSRITNPTVGVLEQRIAALEDGSAAVCTSSGMAATFCAITAILGQGDHIVASTQMYGGNISLMKNTLPRFGITTTFVDPTDIDGFRTAIQANTKLIYGELIGNPGLDILDLEAIAKIGADHHVPFMVDATFNTPYLCRCFDYGANMTIHSVTKWMGGHGAAIGGVVVDGGNFDWGATDKYPTITEPYAPFSGINLWEEFGPSAFATRIRAEAMRDIGPSMSPMNAFLLLQGIETLSLRMDRHLSNTMALLDYLSNHKQVSWVNHPSLPSHSSHDLARKYLPKGAGSIISFGVEGGREAGKAFIENVELASHLANVGDAKTLIIHPATTTHSRIDAAALSAAGITEDMVRLSVGLEDVADITADFDNGFRAARQLAKQ